MGGAFTLAMRNQSFDLSNKVFLTEGIQKPNDIGGAQHYGTKDGLDETRDPLLPIIRQVFGVNANRFNLPLTEINTRLLPVIKDKLKEFFSERGFFPKNFEVIVTLALLSCISMTKFHPENSQTNTSEWTAKIMLEGPDRISSEFLIVGRSEEGGASYVCNMERSQKSKNVGFRISIMFEK